MKRSTGIRRIISGIFPIRKRRIVKDCLRQIAEHCRRIIFMSSARLSGTAFWTAEKTRRTVDISSIRRFPFIRSCRVPRCRNLDYLPRSFVVVGRNWIYEPRRGILRNHLGAIIRDSVNTSVVPKRPPPKSLSDGNRKRLDGVRPATVLRTQDSNYYHTLVDNLPRLYLLDRWLQAHTQESIDVLVPSPLNPAEKYWIPKMLQKQSVLRVIDGDIESITIPRFVYVSPYSRRFKGSLPKDYLDYVHKLINQDRQHVEEENLILVSRPPGAKGGRRILNEAELFARLQPMGFRLHLLESMTVENQIALFRSARIVVAAHGAGLANLVYSSREATVIELFPGNYLIPHYYYLTKSLEQRYTAVFSDRPGRNDNFSVNVDAVVKAVQSELLT